MKKLQCPRCLNSDTDEMHALVHEARRCRITSGGDQHGRGELVGVESTTIFCDRCGEEVPVDVSAATSATHETPPKVYDAFKTTLTIWTSYNTSEVDLVDLAHEANSGAAICVKHACVGLERSAIASDPEGGQSVEEFLFLGTEEEEEEEGVTLRKLTDPLKDNPNWTYWKEIRLEVGSINHSVREAAYQRTERVPYVPEEEVALTEGQLKTIASLETLLAELDPEDRKSICERYIDNEYIEPKAKIPFERAMALLQGEGDDPDRD